MLRRWTISQREWGVIAALALVTALVFGLLVRQMISLPSSDYSTEFQIARNITAANRFATAHVLYQLLLIGLSRLLPFPLETAGLIAATAFYVFAALVIYAMIRSLVGGDDWQALATAAALAFGLLLAAPVILATAAQHNLYRGYIALNVPHNPGIVMLKPLALLLFAFTVGVIDHTIAQTQRTLGIGVGLIALTLLALPNFILVLLPALLILIAYFYAQHDSADLRTLLLRLVLPMAIALAIFYAITHFLIDPQGGVQVAPLLTLRGNDLSLVTLVVKFLLSILFPLTVYTLYWREAKRAFALNLAWIMFLVGAAQMYLLAETGRQALEGNFWWSAQIGLFVLFVVSALFWLIYRRHEPRWRGWLCLGMLALHILGGVIVYAAQFQSVLVWDWW
ncbi:MAG: hypothetical protein GC204_14595 [Chloroflexi bacterium]|nr:hypothetical protein [Chloroflexota bacterium]